MVIEPKFVSVRSFSEGLAAASIDEKRATYGYVDRAGRFVVPPRFEEAEPFSEGVAAVCCVGERTVYIDRNGRPAFDVTFPRGPFKAGRFLAGVALVEMDAVGGAYIDRSGRVIAVVRDGN
jgi:hypothetical protein